MDSLVTVSGLHKSFGDLEVLKGIDFEVARGEVVAIIGPSGSGKSTLMNLIGCLDSPDDGIYRLNGRLVSNMGDNQLANIRNEEIGFVFQTFNLLHRATALHNVEVPLIYAGINRKQRRQKAEAVLRKVGLEDRMNHKPTELSGGQRQRVSLMRALMLDPDLLLLDEPLGALDPMIRFQLQQELKTIFAQLGKIVIMVTHDIRIGGIGGQYTYQK